MYYLLYKKATRASNTINPTSATCNTHKQNAKDVKNLFSVLKNVQDNTYTFLVLFTLPSNTYMYVRFI